MTEDEPARPGIALITGATAGLGAEFAHQLAARHYDLVLVARDAERLESVASTLFASFGISVEVLPADLLTLKGRTAVEKRCAATDSPIELLVNNAGYGLVKRFDENTIADEQSHLDLLVVVPMRLSHAALQQMLTRGSGGIINVASVAGFTLRGTYASAKAWVLNFSRWANYAYRSRGVTVTGLAPGFVHTEFHARMSMDTRYIPEFLWLVPEQVVRGCLRDFDRGRALSVPSIRYKVIVALIRILPLRLVAWASARGR